MNIRGIPCVRVAVVLKKNQSRSFLPEERTEEFHKLSFAYFRTLLFFA